MTIALLVLGNMASLGQVESFIGKWHAPDNNNSTIVISQGDDGIISGEILTSDSSTSVGHQLLRCGKHDSEKNVIKATLYKPDSSTKINATIFSEKYQCIVFYRNSFVSPLN